MHVQPGQHASRQRGFQRWAQFLVRSGVGLALAGASWLACAQAFPSKPITIVVPYPAGGTTDVLARVIAEPMQKILGQQVVVDNKPGASAL